MKIRYPPDAEPGQTRVEWERTTLNPWRQEEKRRLLAERGHECERCGLPTVMDLDEGIIPRCDMGGLDLKQRRLAFGNPNLFLLCMSCNRHEPHDRAGAWERACERYGEGFVREWYASLGLKVPRKEWL